MKSIAIIGGGAAGMMAGIQVIEQSQEVGEEISLLIFEKNPSLGAKVIISGGGRCNVTTGYYRRKDLESKYIRGAEWLRYAIGQFGPRKIYQWFEEHQVPLKIEKDMRVFPVSDNGKDIVAAFEHIFEKSKVECVFGTAIQAIHHENNSFTLSTSDRDYKVDSVIIATGGQAYRQTGSTGDAYSWAESLGHRVTPLGPSLNSFLTSDKRMHELSGIAFENAQVIMADKKSVSGAILLTHFGLSGPLAFIVAAYSAFETIDNGHPLLLKLRIDSHADQKVWELRLLEAAKETPRKQLDTILAQYLPTRIVNSILNYLCGGQNSTAIGQVSRSLRMQITEALGGGIPVHVIGRRPGDEFVTAGGVSLEEVNPETMMSRLIPGLFFAGEVLDVDGVTGGYNLTSSRATGALAGKSAREWLEGKA